jgi:cytochrome c oxidase cbb3-type subunit 3
LPKPTIAGAYLLAFILFSSAPLAKAQTPPPAPIVPPPNPPPRRGGFVPGQKRPPGDPVQIAHGKVLFGIDCRGCHGPDLRGGDLGGPNLLRSQVALSDQNGELIVPIIRGSRQNMGMPAIEMSDADALAVAAYVRSVIETIKGQGAPPEAGRPVPSILIGNASEGKAFFAAKCSACHSVDKDLSKIASRIPDPKRLQDAWLAGAARGEEEASRTAAISFPSGETVEGKLLHIDDFLVTIVLPDGSQRSFRRNGDSPQVVIHDPLEPHRALLSQYTDKDVHDVTAYLVTLK